MSTDAPFPGSVNGVALYSVAVRATRHQEMYEGQVPDATWTFIDASGHFHAYDSDGKLPTLNSRRVIKDCDGTCGDLCGGDGFSDTVYECPLCEAPVEPRTRFGFQRMPARPELLAEVVGPKELAAFDGDAVSFVSGDGFGTGILNVLAVTMSHDGDQAEAEIVLRTPLHRRYGTTMQQVAQEPRVNLTKAFLAGAKAVREPWESLPEASRAEFVRDFATLAATRAITAALPLLGLSEEGEILP